MKEGTAFHSLKTKKLLKEEESCHKFSFLLDWADISMQCDANHIAAPLQLSLDTSNKIWFGFFCH